MNKIELKMGDCLVESAQIQDGSVDLILTDLPYGTVENIGDSDTIQHGMKGKTTWDKVIDTDKIMQIEYCVRMVKWFYLHNNHLQQS